MKCFYHADADGKCAGFWVSRHLACYDVYVTDMIEINYGKPFPIEIIQPNEKVYIVDYSIEPEEMLALLEITKDVTWIDHHKTAIEKYKDFPYDLRGVRIDGVAGCMLTYCYICHMTNHGLGTIKPFDMQMTDDAPYFTKLIADWDVWTFRYGNDTRHFHTAFEAYDFVPGTYDWDVLDVGCGCKKLIEEGVAMTRFRDGWAKSYCKAKGFETTIDGHRAFAMNLALCNSEYFRSISGYEILMPFSYDGENWLVSMYSGTVDVSEIAKKYGGGGHQGASGFQCKELPFKKGGLINGNSN